jgi:hypothetical protein
MRFIANDLQVALDGRAITVRDFIWFVVRDRATGDDVEAGFWSDVTTVDMQVTDPRTYTTQTRRFQGAGELIGISPIPLVSNLTVQTVTVELSQVSNANELIRAYDARQGRVEIFRGLFEPETLVQIAPAYPRFMGFIDEPDILTPAENENGSITLSCVSHTQELTRSNPATRSDTYQRRRSPTDGFRRHAATVGGWDLKWGTKD